MRPMLVLVCALVVAVPGASPARAQGVHVGVKGGLTWSAINTSGEGAFDTSADPAGIIGVTVPIEISPWFWIQPELLWSKRRFSVFPFPDPTDRVQVSASSLEFPVLANFTVAKYGRTRLQVFAGPQLSRIGEVRQVVFGEDQERSDFVKDLDVGIAAGGGVDIAAPRGAVTMEVRVIRGFKNLSEQPPPEITSRAVVFLAGYRF